MCDIRYYKMARHNYEVAKVLRSHYLSDEAYICDIAYNLQQSVEKALKAFLESVGVTVPNTHSINRLISMSKNNGSLIQITEWIENNSYMLESWEVDSRYNFDFMVEIEKIDKAIDEIGKFLEINGLSDVLLSVIDEETKEKIRSLVPDSCNIETNIEWNCYYLTLCKKSKL